MLKKLSAISILTFIVLIAPLQAIAQQPPPTAPPQGYYWPGPSHMWGDGSLFWWMFPLMMLFIGLICVAIFFFGHRASGHALHHWGPSHSMDRPWNDASHSAMQILNERFARAEIQKDEYLDKKATILSDARH